MRTDETRIVSFRAVRFNLYLNYNRKVLAITKKVTAQKASKIQENIYFTPASLISPYTSIEKNFFYVDVIIGFTRFKCVASVYNFVDKVLLLILNNADN